MPTKKQWIPPSPGKLRILYALQKGPLAYSKLKTEAQLQDPSLYKYLRQLLNEKRIDQDPNSRLYRLTRTGVEDATKYGLWHPLASMMLDSPATVLVFYPSKEVKDQKEIDKLIHTLIDATKKYDGFLFMKHNVRGHIEVRLSQRAAREVTR